MDLIHKIESLRYDIENGVVTDVISISVRLIQIKDKALQLLQTGVSGRSEQFVCLCPRNEKDNCDRKEPCKECETCPHLRQTNCH